MCNHLPWWNSKELVVSVQAFCALDWSHFPEFLLPSNFTFPLKKCLVGLIAALWIVSTEPFILHGIAQNWECILGALVVTSRACGWLHLLVILWTVHSNRMFAFFGKDTFTTNFQSAICCKVTVFALVLAHSPSGICACVLVFVLIFCTCIA